MPETIILIIPINIINNNRSININSNILHHRISNFNNLISNNNNNISTNTNSILKSKRNPVFRRFILPVTISDPLCRISATEEEEF